MKIVVLRKGRACLPLILAAAHAHRWVERLMETKRGSITFFVDYYKRLSEEQPDWDHWERGLLLVVKWLYLFDKNSVTQQEIDELMKDLRSEEDPGSGWLDMTSRFWNWASVEGYSVPENINPWAK